MTEVETHKHLEIYLSYDCSWHKHISYIKEKAWNRINVKRKLKFELDRTSLEIIYLTFIRPIFEYGDVIFDHWTNYGKQELEKTQREAARIATGTTKLFSVETLYKEIGWDTLETRRRKHKLTLFINCSTVQRHHTYHQWFFLLLGKVLVKVFVMQMIFK